MHRTGLTATWARYFPVDPFVDFWGNVPSWFITANFAALALTRLKPLWSAFGEDVFEPEGRSVVAEVVRWMGDGVPIAGEMYRTLVRDLYKDNLLLRGGLPMAGRIVELRNIRSSLLTITAGDDRLCPPQAAEALNRVVATEDETAITVPGSHLGAVIGSRAHHLLWTRIVDWLESRSGHHPADW
jgi:polyhydroxyalkanoate synthase